MDKFQIEQRILQIENEIKQLDDGICKVIGNKACISLIVSRRGQIRNELIQLKKEFRRWGFEG